MMLLFVITAKGGRISHYLTRNETIRIEINVGYVDDAENN